MAEHERRLLSKALHTGRVEELIAEGINTAHFSNENLRSVWETITNHLIEYRVPPSVEAVIDLHKDMRLSLVEDSFEFVLDDFKKKTRRRLSLKQLEIISQAIDDPKQAVNIEDIFLDSARMIAQAVPSGKIARFSEMHDRITRYKNDQISGVTRGITTGIPALDEITFGIHPHEFVVISGFTGTGKSTLLQHMFHRAYLENNVTPMFISLEMEAEALCRKWDAMSANLTYQNLKGLNLKDEELAQWEKVADRVENLNNDIIIIDKVPNCTVEKVFAEANRYKPDIIGIDYLSLMQTPRGSGQHWEKITYITNHLKQMSRSLKIPIVAITQTNRSSAADGAKLDNISYSQSVSQDADIVLGLFADDEMREQKRMELRMLKNRDGLIKNIDMYWDMAKMDFREYTPTDMFTVRKNAD